MRGSPAARNMGGSESDPGHEQPPRSARRIEGWVWLGLAVALALRVGFAARSFDGKQIFGDQGFHQLATNLLETGVYSAEPPEPTAYREPGYTLLLTALYAVSKSSPWSVLLAHAALSVATVYLICLLAGRVFDPWAGRFAFWAACFYPYFIYYGAFFFRETLLVFLVSASFLLVVGSGRLLSMTSAGALAGWTCLANGALSPMVAAIAAAAAFGRGRPRRWKAGLAFLLPVAVLTGVWVGRNLVVMRAFVPASTLVGVQMYWALAVPYEALGTEEQNRILGGRGDDTEFQRLAALSETESNKAFQKAAWGMIMDRPFRFAWDCAGRFFGMWRFVPRDRTYSHRTSLVRLMALLSDGWILPLAVLGLVTGWGRPWVRWMALFALVVTATYSISHAPIRYRMPLMPFVLVLAAGGASWLRSSLSRARKR